MRVRFTREWVSPNRVRHHYEGEVVNVSNALATRLATQGTVELLHRQPPVDTRDVKVDVEQYHVGHGWYALPGLDKKVRRADALIELRG